jgi:HK97 family phage portal protein
VAGVWTEARFSEGVVMAIKDFIGGFMSLGVEPKPAQLPDPAKLPWKSQAQLIAEHAQGIRTRTIEQIHEERIQTRAIDSFTSYPGLTAQLLAVQGLTDRPWRFPSISEALGVPAIFGAVNMIANLIGSLSMRALRNEVELRPADRPRLIVRPDPFTIPREFYRGTGYNLATRGEAWWWSAKRDVDDLTSAILSLPPHEMTVEENRDNPFRPIIKWRDNVIPNEDIRQLVYSREPGALRGHGPLQMCGAAISVAVEAQEWAANFFMEDGGHPSILIKSATELGQGTDGVHEADTIREAWMSKPHNTPRVIDPGIESVEEVGVNAQGAAMLQARGYQNSEVATMFNMDATLLNAAISGSSVTYQNVGSEFEKFLRQCLQPNYLEVIEQTMSDLLPRTITARFNTSALTLADVKTRYDVYGIGIDKGIIEVEEARRFEGYAPGDVENASVPFSPPAAFPTRLPVQLRTEAGEVRCDGTRLLKGLIKPCNAKLAEQGPFTGSCWRCGKTHQAAA